ncbi:MAG: hypothetical protein ACRDCW_14270 [Sarcina sp.]
MKKKTLLLCFIILAIAILIVVYSKHIHSSNPMVIKQEKEIHGLYYVSNSKLAFAIELTNDKGENKEPYTNVTLINPTKDGTYSTVCPQNSFTNELVKDNLNYKGMVTIQKLGLSESNIKQLTGKK